MAFIKENPRSDYSYYNVVETVYKDGDPRHNELRYIEVDLDEIDPSLLPDFYELLVEHDYDFAADQDYQSQYALEEITPTQAVDYGPVAALHAIAEKLELPSVLESHFQPKSGGPPLGDLLLIQIHRSVSRSPQH